jgi:hypothetical protein
MTGMTKPRPRVAETTVFQSRLPCAPLFSETT